MPTSSNRLKNPDDAVLAVMLPVTSRGVLDIEQTLLDLSSCLPPPKSCILFIGIDVGDPIYDSSTWVWSEVFPGYKIKVELFIPSTPTPIWPMACKLARMALECEGEWRCDLFCLLGDDVTISPRREWLKSVIQSFSSIQECLFKDSGLEVEWGFGVVALRDETFHGFPTFPIVGRPHLDIFKGELVPSIFVNQDGDPYQWELYRRYGAAFYAEGVTLKNGIGGDEDNPARYTRVNAVEWKDGELKYGVRQIADFLTEKNTENIVEDAKTLCIDVIVPSFRCPLERLRRMVSLQIPQRCSMQFVFILDDPVMGPGLRCSLEENFNELVRVRVNSSNMGASYSRNRGLEESSADWVIFLDDDVEPHPTVLAEYAEAIRRYGHAAAGFVGLTLLPIAQNPLTKALQMSYVTYFWGVAILEQGGAEAPWGVTANVCTRRPKSRFDLRFPKTGGGEDIDFLQHVVEELGLPLLKAPEAIVTHPWWNNGIPSPSRFYGWARGDSLLQDKFPQYTYSSWPNVWELSYLSTVFQVVSFPYNWNAAYPLQTWMTCVCAFWITDLALDVFHLMVEDTNVQSDTTGFQRLLCALLSNFYKNSCELGHLHSAIDRHYLYMPFLLCKRYDWWHGKHALSIVETRNRERTRFIIMVASTAITVSLVDGVSTFLLGLIMTWGFIVWISFATSTTTGFIVGE